MKCLKIASRPSPNLLYNLSSCPPCPFVNWVTLSLRPFEHSTLSMSRSKWEQDLGAVHSVQPRILEFRDDFSGFWNLPTTTWASIAPEMKHQREKGLQH